MSLSKPLTLRHLYHFLNNIPCLFYHRHIVFFTISLVRNTKWDLPKKVLLNDLEKSCEQLFLLSSSKQLQLPNPFLPLWNQLKSVLGPAGKRSSSPWAWCTTALTITPPCQLLNSHPFFILPNRFFHSVTDAKELAGEPGIDPRSAPHHYTTVIFLFYLTFFFHSWANLL